ncbi:hypothetical protein CH367_10465 [Leptospira barantonii]|uniref:Peptidase M50 domain-containing protein n=1 Tax=Leptospira barantonii TaxID=2023184 RepID=A0ABX4NLJ5_9LEPT|nr:hypothetical protein CH367_10465 [Leptospira barantonii]
MPPYLIFLLSSFISTPLNIILHEFGHAIAALMFTKSTVHINLCDGTTKNLFEITIGRFRITFSWRNLFYHSGLTIHAPVESLITSRIIFLSGVAFNGIIALPLFGFIALNFSSDFIQWMLIGFFFNFLLLSLGNLYPREIKVGGKVYGTDGLLFIRSFQKSSLLWAEIATALNKQAYAEAASIIVNTRKLPEFGFDQLRTIIYYCLRPVGYSAIARVIKHFAKDVSGKDDFFLLGLAYAHLNETEKAKLYFTKVSQIEPDNYGSRISLAFLSMVEGDFIRAQHAFTEIYKVNPTAYVCAHLAYIFGRLGDVERQNSLMHEAELLDGSEAYLHRTRALIYLDQGLIDKAQEAYSLAVELNNRIYPIQRLSR